MISAAAFLDRDGTLIEDSGFIGDPARVKVLPTVPEALRVLGNAGFARIVVSNQSGVARAYFSLEDVRRVQDEVEAQLRAEGAQVDAFYFCPHYNDGCECRKPLTGMLERAVRERGVDLARSAMVGDRGVDIATAHAAGIPGVLVPTSYSYEGPEPDYRAVSLLDAAHWIVAHGAR